MTESAEYPTDVHHTIWSMVGVRCGTALC